MESPARLTIALCWWQGWRPIYELAHVNAMARMLREYVRIPHRLVLLTDQPARTAEVDEVLPVPQDPEGLQLIKQVNCYRRLRFFDPEYTAQFGTEWVMSIDLDTLVRSDITGMIESAMEHPYGLWIIKGRWADRKPGERPYNGALFMVRCGAHAAVWQDFDPIESPKEIHRIQWVGSDQSWIGLKAPDAPTFGPAEGVYFLGQYTQERTRARVLGKAIAPARIVNYAGKDKPWSKSTKFQAKDLWQEYMQWMHAAPRPESIAASIS